MPKLVDSSERETRDLILPSSTAEDEAKVTVYTRAIAGDIEEIGKYQGNQGQMQLAALVRGIKNWNFTIKDSEGKDLPAPITYENVAKLDMVDMWFIVKESGMMEQYQKTVKLSEQKKNT